MNVAGIFLKIQDLRYYIEKHATELPQDLKDRVINDLLKIENEISYLL